MLYLFLAGNIRIAHDWQYDAEVFCSQFAKLEDGLTQGNGYWSIYARNKRDRPLQPSEMSR
jgi:hypothetical protein